MIYITLKNLKEITNRFNEIKCKKSYITIGSVIRSRRLQLDLTLEQLSEEICCVGFISKLERNIVENVNESIVVKLCERLDLDYEKLIVATNGELLESALDYFLRKDTKALEKLCSDLEKIPFPTNELLRAMSNLLNEDYFAFNDAILKVDSIKHTLSPLEYGTLLMIMIRYMIKTCQFNLALEYLTYLKLLKLEDFYINTFEKEATFIINCYLNKDIEHTYNDLRESFDFYYPLKDQLLLRFEYLKATDPEKSLKAIENLEKDPIIKNININTEYYYTKCYINLKCGNYEKVVDLVKSLNYKQNRDIALYALAIANLKLQGKIDEIGLLEEKANINTYLKNAKHQNEDNIHAGLINVAQYIIEDSSEMTVINEIKDGIVPLYDTYQYPIYEEFTNKLFFTLLGKQTKYKDAYLFMDKLYFKGLR